MLRNFRETFFVLLAVFLASLTGRFEGLPRIKCRRGGVFGGPDIIDFTYQSLDRIPKKKFSNLRRCEEGLAGGPGQPGLQGFDPPLPTSENNYHLIRSRAVFALWQGQHRLCRLLSASVPPCAFGMMWSTVFASLTTPTRRHN